MTQLELLQSSPGHLEQSSRSKESTGKIQRACYSHSVQEIQEKERRMGFLKRGASVRVFKLLEQLQLFDADTASVKQVWMDIIKLITKAMLRKSIEDFQGPLRQHEQKNGSLGSIYKDVLFRPQK
jgi:hypothetical protein